MNKKIIVYLIILLPLAENSFAQWTPQDSIWLENVLAGKDSLRLNPETMKAIQNGSFLNLKTAPSELIMAPSELPISKDFTRFIQHEEDNKQRIVPLEQLPVMVFRRHQVKVPKSEFTLSKSFFAPFGEVIRSAPKPSGRDFGHVLNYAFSKEYRQHYINAQRAKNVVNYNNVPLLEDIRHKREMTEKQAELPLPFVTRRDTVKAVPATNQSSVAPDSTYAGVPADSLLNKRLPL